jgi:hypothetical protein
MHPTAATLALCGFKPYLNYTDCRYRIKRGQKNGEPMLTFSNLHGWHTTHGASLKEYSEIEWGVIAPIMGEISQNDLDWLLNQ